MRKERTTFCWLWLLLLACPWNRQDGSVATLVQADSGTGQGVDNDDDDSLYKLDDGFVHNNNNNDDHDDDALMHLFEYKYDVDAIHAQWNRDLVWDDGLDQEIRSRHQDYATRDNARRLKAAPSASDLNEQQEKQDFINSLYQGDLNEEVSCFIGYKSLQGRQKIIRAAYNTSHLKHDFSKVNSIAITLSKAQLIALLETDKFEHLDFIEADQKVTPNQVDSATTSQLASQQVMPYGISLAQGGLTLPHSSQNNCQRKKSFKVGIVDAGFAVGHPDLACSSAKSVNCMGR
jgi:hypothetical protein